MKFQLSEIPLKYFLLSLSLTAASHSQTSVDWNSALWRNFGTSTQNAVSGTGNAAYPPVTVNFLPGWEGVSGSADFTTNNTYGFGNTTLSGSSNDAGLWMLALTPGTDINSDGLPDQETVRLILTNFDPGQTYKLDFSATILHHSGANWNGSSGTLGVAITGADIASWNTSLLTDPTDGDSLNNWISQSLTFTPVGDTVSFLWNVDTLTTADNFAARFGIDGISLSQVPEPSAMTLATLGTCGLLLKRRRNKACETTSA